MEHAHEILIWVYGVQCTLSNLRCRLYTVYCTEGTVYPVHFTVYSVRRAVFDIPCSAYTARMYDIQYISRTFYVISIFGHKKTKDFGPISVEFIFLESVVIFSKSCGRLLIARLIFYKPLSTHSLTHSLTRSLSLSMYKNLHLYFLHTSTIP